MEANVLSLFSCGTLWASCVSIVASIGNELGRPRATIVGCVARDFTMARHDCVDIHTSQLGIICKQTLPAATAGGAPEPIVLKKPTVPVLGALSRRSIDR